MKKRKTVTRLGKKEYEARKRVITDVVYETLHDERALHTTEAMASKSANPKLAAGIRKTPLRLIPLTALPYMAVVMTVGKTKYTAFNWRQTEISRLVYLEAIFRHLLAAMDGEDTDEETGEPHEASIMACAAIALDAMTTGRIIDDRYKTGTLGALLKRTAVSAQAAAERVEATMATKAERK